MPKPAKKARQRQLRQERAIRLAQARRKRRQKLGALGGIIIVMGVIGTLLITTTNNDRNDSNAAAPKQETPCPQADGTSERRLDFEKAPPMCINQSKSYVASFDTTEGVVRVALDTTKTPKTTNNFVVLSRYHYYDNTKFFRTDTSIDIIQGGSPHTQSNADDGPGYTIEDEGKDYTYESGDLIMARSSVGADAQFFFGAGPKVALLNADPRDASLGSYVTFGRTTEGKDVLEKILALNPSKNDPSKPSDAPPSRDVMINTVTITES